jgi:hypothetical protein
MVRGSFKKIIVGKQRRFSRSQVSENSSTSLLARIGELTDRIPVLAAAGLPRLLQAPAADIVQPTMIETAQSAVLDSSVAQVCPSVRAMDPQESDTSLFIAEQDQFFA